MDDILQEDNRARQSARPKRVCMLGSSLSTLSASIALPEWVESSGRTLGGNSKGKLARDRGGKTAVSAVARLGMSVVETAQQAGWKLATHYLHGMALDALGALAPPCGCHILRFSYRRIRHDMRLPPPMARLRAGARLGEA